MTPFMWAVVGNQAEISMYILKNEKYHVIDLISIKWLCQAISFIRRAGRIINFYMVKLS